MVPFIPLFQHLDAALEQTKPEKAPVYNHGSAIHFVLQFFCVIGNIL